MSFGYIRSILFSRPQNNILVYASIYTHVISNNSDYYNPCIIESGFEQLFPLNYNNKKHQIITFNNRKLFKFKM
jgi:hypothetical protein